jgi:hypothetical protein
MATHQSSSSKKTSTGPQKPAPVGKSGAHEPGQPESPFIPIAAGSAVFSGRPEDILTLQRKVGNQVVQRLVSEKRIQSRPTHLTGKAYSQAASTQPDVEGNRLPAGSVQRKEENEEALRKIQHLAMFSLLPALEGLPDDVRTDEEAGQFVGGPRLVAAMHVVAAKGTPWMEYVTSKNGELAVLPADQINNVMTYLGAPKDAWYFGGDDFDNKFDGSVDPSKGVVTLHFRVRFEAAPGARFGFAKPPSDEWTRETQEAMQKFSGDFKRVVEKAWSRQGTIKPSCAFGAIKSFQTQVSISVVDSGEHTVMYINNEVPGGRSGVSKDKKIGNLKISDNEMKTKDVDHQVLDERGRRAGKVTTEQTASAHEFGHAIGLDHPVCKHGADICYGKTAEERRSMMGAGNKLSVIQRDGDIKHNEFEPFLRIGRRWGQEVWKGALQAKCNNWSAG